MIVFPIGATLVALAFALATWRAAKPTETALRVWSVALAQFAVASFALAWGIGFGWTPLVYRAFYYFGAILNVAWLALGTIWLLAPRRAAAVSNAVIVVAATIAGALVLGSDLARGAQASLATEMLPPPSHVMSSVPRLLARIFSIGGSVVVLAGLLWSLVRRRYAAGLAMLALGVLVAGAASEFGRAGSVIPFTVGLAGGIGLMYAGFLKTKA